MATEHQLRVSDADRHRLVAELDRHTAAGRLDLDEYTDRVDQAFRARTYGELAAIVADLPAVPPTDGQTSARQLVVAFLVALLALLVIGVAVAVFR
jgi:hypothetical protein